MQKIDFQEKCLLGLSFSRPPAPLNVCVIREVFFYPLITRFSMPAAPLGLFRSLIRNSAGFLCPDSACCFLCKKQLEYLHDSCKYFFSMPAEPLGSFENLKLNSGGFFCVSFQRLNAKLRNIAL